MAEPVEPGRTFELQDYYEHPERYRPILEDYVPYLTVLINGILWSPRYPRFITKAFLKEHGQSSSLRLRVIGDISCDIHGAMECTVRCTNPGNPVFTYHPETEQVEDGISGKGVGVMALDNLPAEISLESSVFFSQTLKPFLPALAAADFSRDFPHTPAVRGKS